MSFNKSVIAEGNDRGILEASSIMRACVQRLMQKRSEDTEEDLFLKCEWDKYPDFSPFDVYLYPTVVLASILLSRAETLMMSTQMVTGAQIQAGAVHVDPAKVEQVMMDIYGYFNEALEVLFTAAPHYKRSGPAEGSLVMEDSLASADEPASTSQLSSLLDELDHNTTHDVPDVSILKENVINFLLLNRIKNGDSSNLQAVANAAAKILKSNYEIIVSNKTAEILHMPDGYVKRTNTGAPKSAKPSKTLNEKSHYKATAQDQSTVMAEVVPLVESFGRDDVGAWIQWALALSGGASMGMLW